MNIIFGILFCLSGVSFSYRYIKWFSPNSDLTTRRTIWIYGSVIQVALFVDILTCNLDIWVSALFIFAIALAVVHDILFIIDIRTGLFGHHQIGLAKIDTSTAPISFIVGISAAIAALTRSHTSGCQAGNGVILGHSILSAGIILYIWRLENIKTKDKISL